MRFYFSTIVTFGVILATSALQAQPHNFVVYSLAQGLPQSQVYATLQDSKGYLWLGTQGGGLCRFDGLDFQTFTTEHGLPSNYVNAVFEDAQHRLWVGTNAGLCYLNGTTVEKIPAVETNGLQIFAFCETPEKQLWIGADQGIFICNAESKTLKKADWPGFTEKRAVWSFISTGNGIWAATDLGAFRLGNAPLTLNVKNGLLSNAVRGFALDARRRLWLATAGGGVAVFDENTGKMVERYPNPAWTTCLLSDPDGNIWVGTSDNGLAIFNPADSSWLNITEKQGFPHHYVRAMTVDNAGNSWVGTSGGGLVKFLGRQPFMHYGPAQGLAGSRVYALQPDSRGRLLMAVSQAGLQVLDSFGIVPFALDSGRLSGVKTKTVAEDQFGRVWVGTEGRGALVFDTGGVISVPGLPSNMIQKIIPGAAGEMWVATTAGLARVNYSAGFDIRVYGQKDGLKGLIISTLFMDARGGLWFADQLGNLGFIQNGKVEKIYGEAQGLPGPPVRCIVSNAAGRIWAGIKGAGIYEADGTAEPLRFFKLNTPKKMASDNIYLLVFDAAGNLWAGSESGVDKITFEQGKVADNQHFGRNEGFLGIETCQDAAFCDRFGNLWFGTMNGLMKYTPSSRKAADVPPILHFEAVTLFYKPLHQTKYNAWVNPTGGLLPGLELPWNENHLSFEFRAVDLAHPDALRYRWRLDGSPNAQWSPLSTQTAVNFAGLQPGSYMFSVQATADGVHFSEAQTAAFVVLQPFWQHPGFQLGMGLLLAGLIFLIVRSRIRRIRVAEAEKRAQLEIQNKLLQLEQKALQLQMNPHFIFNALNSIQSLVSSGDANEARLQIGHFAQLMRGILNNSRKPLISLKEEADTLEQYLRLEQFCQQNKFTYHIALPGNTDPEELEIPPMMIQPFVENAVIHGVSHLKRPGNIEVVFTFSDHTLHCAVRDNGVGREAAAQLRQERKPGHQSVAMAVTRERLEALRTGAGEPAFQIRDILDAAGEIAGTEVLIQIPVKVNF